MAPVLASPNFLNLVPKTEPAYQSPAETPESQTPIQDMDIKTELNVQMDEDSDELNPLNLSMAKKTSKPIYVLDSDEETEIITIDSDDDDDDKGHFQKIIPQFFKSEI